jgi:hypothetical protein
MQLLDVPAAPAETDSFHIRSQPQKLVLVSIHMTQGPGVRSSANNRFEFARYARPTRKGEAPLLAAQAGR